MLIQVLTNQLEEVDGTSPPQTSLARTYVGLDGRSSHNINLIEKKTV